MTEIELKPQEASVFELMVEGKGNREIALELGVSYASVGNYVSSVYKKVGTKDRRKYCPELLENISITVAKNNKWGIRNLEGLQDVYDFILDHKISNDGNSPSIREIVAGTGYASTNTVANIIVALEQIGALSTPQKEGMSRQFDLGGHWEPPKRKNIVQSLLRTGLDDD